MYQYFRLIACVDFPHLQDAINAFHGLSKDENIESAKVLDQPPGLMFQERRIPAIEEDDVMDYAHQRYGADIVAAVLPDHTMEAREIGFVGDIEKH